MRTIGSIMKDNGGIGPGFDMLRVGLAYAVVMRHCWPLVYGSEEAAGAGFVWVATQAIVPVFFILSGFLVTGSAMRLPLGKFAASRVLRIVPALAVDTVVTIVLIGALFTTLPLGAYYSDPQTLSYLWNILGYIHYFLPGVFETNPHVGVVNGSLWTIKPELGCYVFLAALMVIGWAAEWKRTLAIALALLAIIAAAPLFPDDTPRFIQLVVNNPGAILVPEFLIGSVLYHKRDAIPYSWALFWICVALVVLSGIFLPAVEYSTMPISTAIAIPVYGYIAVFVGCTEIPKVPLFSKGDYSYGIYLYGFPVQQAIVAATGVSNPFLLFLLAIVPITAFAMFSWHVVEKPTLKLRKGFSMARKLESHRSS